MPTYPTNFVPKGDVTLYQVGGKVRSWSGAAASNRGTKCLTAADIAQVGDTIVVGPGTFIPTEQLLRPGVNWKFVNSQVTLARESYGGLFDDSAAWGLGEAVACTISGDAEFIRANTDAGLAAEALCVVLLDNASSNVSITCKSIADNGAGTSANGAVRHAGGTLKITCETITSANANGIWWSDGELDVVCDSIETEKSCFYSSANDSTGGSATGHLSDLWASGDAWLRVHRMTVNGTTGTYASPIYTSSDIGTPRIWAFVTRLENQGDGPVINCGGNFVYVEGMKDHQTYAGTVLFGTSAIKCANDGELWVKIQKLIGGKNGNVSAPNGTAIDFLSGKAWIEIMDLADNGSATDPLVWSHNNDNGNASELTLTCHTIRKAANGTAIRNDEALNTVTLLQGAIRTQSGQLDLHQTAGTINVAAGVEVSPSKITGTITWLGGYSAFRAINSVAAVTLTDGATPALNAALGKIFRLTAAGNRTIAVPSNPTDGQAIIIEHTASGGSRTLALNTGTGGFAFTTDVTALTATSSGVTDRIGCIYNLTENKWRVVAYNKGA